MNIAQMARRCPNTEIYGNGRLTGWTLVFNFHADIIYTGEESDIVPVVVWKINDERDLSSLDMYEGFPHYYVREELEVTMDSGEVLTALVYVMAEKRRGIYPPDEHYFGIILEGYNANGIDTAPLYEALEFSKDPKNVTVANQYNPI